MAIIQFKTKQLASNGLAILQRNSFSNIPKKDIESLFKWHSCDEVPFVKGDVYQDWVMVISFHKNTKHNETLLIPDVAKFDPYQGVWTNIENQEIFVAAWKFFNFFRYDDDLRKIIPYAAYQFKKGK